MNRVEELARRLPLMEESRLPLAEAAPAPSWWEPPAELLPLVARPQLHQELEELFRFASSERLQLVPFGSASGWYEGAACNGRPALLVQPGHTTVWRGVVADERYAWLPGGLTLAEAEALLTADGFTLGLSPEDRGTVAGNWLQPRGSFLVREFRHPAARGLGIRALLWHGGWLHSRQIPRSAAGPDLGRGARGSGAWFGLVTEVALRVQPLAERRTGTTTFADASTVLEAVQRLVGSEYWPTSCSVWREAEGCWRLRWSQNLWSGWAERTWREAQRELGLAEEEAAPPQPEPGTGARFLPWSELAAALAAGEVTHWGSPTPEGAVAWGQRPPAPPPAWTRWWREAGREVLCEQETTG